MNLRTIIILVSATACAVQGADTATRVGTSAPIARVPQAPPMPPAPIQFFRDLLPMTAEQRQTALEKYSARSREFVTAKLREYEALTPEERENRLRTLEMRWHL